jgi:hypothetical protein
MTASASFLLLRLFENMVRAGSARRSARLPMHIRKEAPAFHFTGEISPKSETEN